METRNAYRIFVRKPLGKYLLERPRSRWGSDIKIDRKGRGYEDRR
jgi:hypothetical protein